MHYLRALLCFSSTFAMLYFELLFAWLQLCLLLHYCTFEGVCTLGSFMTCIYHIGYLVEYNLCLGIA
jgi:hypothetical protein